MAFILLPVFWTCQDTFLFFFYLIFTHGEGKEAGMKKVELSHIRLLQSLPCSPVTSYQLSTYHQLIQEDGVVKAQLATWICICPKMDSGPGMDREAIFVTGRGGAGRGLAKNLWDGAGRGTPPSPQCGAGRGRGQNLRGGEGLGRGTYCVYQLIEIICCSKGNLNLHCIM